MACYAKSSYDGEVSMCPLGSTGCWMPFFSSAPTLGMSLCVRAAGVFTEILGPGSWKELQEVADEKGLSPLCN